MPRTAGRPEPPKTRALPSSFGRPRRPPVLYSANTLQQHTPDQRHSTPTSAHSADAAREDTRPPLLIHAVPPHWRASVPTSRRAMPVRRDVPNRRKQLLPTHVLTLTNYCGSLARRKPKLLMRLPGSLLLRFAERQFLAKSYQLPPRRTTRNGSEPWPTGSVTLPEG